MNLSVAVEPAKAGTTAGVIVADINVASSENTASSVESMFMVPATALLKTLSGPTL